MICAVLFLVFVLLMACSGTAHAQCPALNSLGLVMHWKLDETAGTAVTDATGNIPDGTVTGGSPTWLPAGGVIDGALRTATTDSISAPSPNAILDGLDDVITFALWVKDNGSNAWGPALRKLNNGVSGWQLERNNATNDADLRVDTSAGSSQAWMDLPNVYDGSWHHVAIVLDNGNAWGYVDGVEVDSTTYNHGNGFGTTDPLLLITGFAGDRDDVRIYNRALSADEIAALYAVRSTADAPAGYMTYDFKSDAMIYCNGTDWVHAGVGAITRRRCISTGEYFLQSGDLSLPGIPATGTGSFWFRR